MSLHDVTGGRDEFYEWLLSDASAARAERIRRRRAQGARAERELAEVGEWCQRTLANPDASAHLRALADTLTRISTRRNAREAAEAAVPDEVWVVIERERYEIARRVAGDFHYRYPARYLGAQAAEQPIPDEVITSGAVRPGDRLRLARTGPVFTVAHLETVSEGWDIHTTDGRCLRFTPSSSVHRVQDAPDRATIERNQQAPAEQHARSRQDPELEL